MQRILVAVSAAATAAAAVVSNAVHVVSPTGTSPKMLHARVPSGTIGKAEDPMLKYMVDGARPEQLKVRELCSGCASSARRVEVYPSTMLCRIGRPSSTTILSPTRKPL